MTYILQGVICRPEAARTAALPWCQLGEGFALVPFTEPFRKDTAIEWLTLSYSEPEHGLRDLLGRVSANGPILYVEAELWAGLGDQTSWLWKHSEPVGEPLVAEHAINEGLVKLGIQARPGVDQFDMLGLGTHRDTEEWPSAPEGAPPRGG